VPSTDLTRRLQRVIAPVEGLTRRAMRPLGRRGFPLLPPPVPTGVEVPETPDDLGAEYDTDWARRPLASGVRRVITRGPLRLATMLAARPSVDGVDRLSDLAELDPSPPLIFAPNHHSHLDTLLMSSVVPNPWREHLVVAAAADYFFDQRWKAALSALALNAIPIDREVTNRRSSDRFRELVEGGSSLLIYPEGGRSPDGWGQSFRGGAAYLSARTGAAVVPVYIDGTGAIFGKGASRLRPGRTRVVFGRPIRPAEGENTRRFNERIEQAVNRLALEANGDFWSAARMAASGDSTGLHGPSASTWRRAWDLTEFRRRGVGGRSARARAWPDLGRRSD